MEMVLWESDQK